MDGWPTQARFWLEWGCSDLLNSVIPARADHRERNDLWSGEPALSLSKGTLYLSAAVFATMRQDVRDRGDRVGMDAAKARTSAAKFCPAGKLPHSSQNRA